MENFFEDTYTSYRYFNRCYYWMTDRFESYMYKQNYRESSRRFLKKD